MSDPTNSMDVIDSRDVISRIDELESEVDDLYLDGWDDDTEQSDGDDEDAIGQLRILLALQEEAEPYAADWRHGETLIRDSYFEEYAQQLAEDIGAVDRDANWPLNRIDWEAAADDLKVDYTTVDFDGVEYWIR